MNSNPIIEFTKVSHDFQVLINSKIRRGEQNKTIAEEASTLEWYYNEMESLFTKYSDREHLNKLELFQERIKSKLLERELMNLINAAIKGNNEEVNKCITDTNFDTSDIDFNKKVIFKEKVDLSDEAFKKVKQKYDGGVKLKEILKHCFLTKTQLFKLVDD